PECQAISGQVISAQAGNIPASLALPATSSSVEFSAESRTSAGRNRRHSKLVQGYMKLQYGFSLGRGGTGPGFRKLEAFRGDHSVHLTHSVGRKPQTSGHHWCITAVLPLAVDVEGGLCGDSDFSPLYSYLVYFLALKHKPPYLLLPRVRDQVIPTASCLNHFWLKPYRLPVSRNRITESKSALALPRPSRHFPSRCRVNISQHLVSLSLSEKGEMVVDRQVSFSFTLGKYSDEILGDVVPMEATHILLGKPWTPLSIKIAMENDDGSPGMARALRIRPTKVRQLY
ncbi:hypothetical protein CR513_37103, partial [Mucuna pruriens]